MNPIQFYNLPMFLYFLKHNELPDITFKHWGEKEMLCIEIKNKYALNSITLHSDCTCIRIPEGDLMYTDKTKRQTYSLINTQAKLNQYWHQRMQQIVNDKIEVAKLLQVLKTNLSEHNNLMADNMHILDFWDSKRPYGNKNIEMSIVYNLGRDTQDLRLTYVYIPKTVLQKARHLHKQVRVALENELKLTKKR